MYYLYIDLCKHTYVNSYTIAMVSVTTNKSNSQKETQSKVENSSCR